ncbi:MAG: universal stress protein [Pseudomonadota bacterium]
MQRFKNILFVADKLEGPDTAFERARALAKRNNAALKVVITMTSTPNRRLLGGERVDDIVRDYYRERLELKLREVHDDGIEVTGAVIEGTFVKIIQEVIAGNHDLVMKTSENRNWLHEKIFGSTDMHLMRKCPTPVWIFKDDQSPRFKKILVAIDPGAPSAEAESLNIKALQLGTSLAEQDQSELEIVYCWRLDGETILRGRAFGRRNEAAIDDLLSVEENHHAQLLKNVTAPFGLPHDEARLHLFKGDARVVIPRMAEADKVELIIMGTLCRNGIAGAIIGNTAEEILSQVQCSVLTIKPDGFVSPVHSDGSGLPSAVDRIVSNHAMA